MPEQFTETFGAGLFQYDLESTAPSVLTRLISFLCRTAGALFFAQPQLRRRFFRDRLEEFPAVFLKFRQVNDFRYDIR